MVRRDSWCDVVVSKQDACSHVDSPLDSLASMNLAL